MSLDVIVKFRNLMKLVTDVFVVEVRLDLTGQWLYTQVQTSFFFHNFFYVLVILKQLCFHTYD